MAGGGAGQIGCNRIEYADGSIAHLGYASSVDLSAGDLFVIETPGGGGYGSLPDA